MESILNVSYSKAQAFKTCKYKFNLAHVEIHPSGQGKGLMPIHKSKALARGSFGHHLLETILKRVQQLDFPYRKEEVAQITHEEIARGLLHEDSQYLTEVSAQIEYFMIEIFPAKYWKILDVEKEFRLPVGVNSEGVKYVVPVTIDLIVQTEMGIAIIDHKFAADDYKSPRIDIEPQLPIYAGVCRAMGVKVVAAYYNFLRTRPMKNVADQCVLTQVDINNTRIQKSFQEHFHTLQEIDSWDGVPARNVNNNCSYCDFSKICASDMNGQDVSVAKEVNFVPNDYGYDEV